MEDTNKKGKSEVFTKTVRAGKRTYFFDVKSTRDESLYITVTESKKRFKNEGGFFYEKHKLFLYKEDFVKFTEGLEEVIAYIRENNPTPVVEQTVAPENEVETETAYSEVSSGTNATAESSSFTDLDFDDLGK